MIVNNSNSDCSQNDNIDNKSPTLIADVSNAISADVNAADRWRLLLGEVSQSAFGDNASSTVQQMQSHLNWLYSRPIPANGANYQGEQGGQAMDALNQEAFNRQANDANSTLSTPEWINNIETLFPKETVERLQQDALDTYQLEDLVTNAEVLSRATPNPVLLAAVLRTKHLMNPEVLAMARKLVKKVVSELMAALKQEMQRSFSGQRSPMRLKPYGSSNQLALKDTLKRNIKNYDPKRRQIIVSQPWFYTFEEQQPQPWQMIILVDQSGSMVSSVIHSAVTAACFWGIKNLKTHLLAFDSQVVDLTSDIQDPVELLMQVQLGGGTDIAKAVSYATDLVSTPKRAIVVIISDFYEGGDEDWLIRQVSDLTTQGSRVLALTALDNNANPSYCHTTAKRMTRAGADVAAMTPSHLAEWLAEVMR